MVLVSKDGLDYNKTSNQCRRKARVSIDKPDITVIAVLIFYIDEFSRVIVRTNDVNDDVFDAIEFYESGVE